MLLSILIRFLVNPFKEALGWLVSHPKVLLVLAVVGLLAYASREVYIYGWNAAIHAQRDADQPVVNRLAKERDTLQERIDAMNALAEQQQKSTEADAKTAVAKLEQKKQVQKDALKEFINSLPEIPNSPEGCASSPRDTFLPAATLDHINKIHRILE